MRIVFWSFERGTWPYDIAVAAIVAFVLLSPRAWFEDRPAGTLSASAVAVATPSVEWRGADPADGSQTYRVDARLLASQNPGASDNLQQQLHEAVRQNAKHLAYGTDFYIVRVAPVPDRDGNVAYYDVLIQPQE